MEVIKNIYLGIVILIAIMDISIIFSINERNQKIDEASLEYFCKGEKKNDDTISS